VRREAGAAGGVQGGEMTQTMYAHVNKLIKKKKNSTQLRQKEEPFGHLFFSEML
jgi:hypothetical protein